MELPVNLEKHINKVYIYKSLSEEQIKTLNKYFKKIDTKFLEYEKEEKYIYIFFDEVEEKWRASTDKYSPKIFRDEFREYNITELFKSI